MQGGRFYRCPPGKRRAPRGNGGGPVKKAEVTDALEDLEVAEHRCERGVHQGERGTREEGSGSERGLEPPKLFHQCPALCFPGLLVAGTVKAADIVERDGGKFDPAAMAGFTRKPNPVLLPLV